MTALKQIPTSQLIPYANNSRTHSQDQIKQVAASIKEFGFLNPVITDGANGIVAGHCRVMAAELLGLDEVLCLEASHLSEAQKKAYVIADNKLAENAGWDYEALRIEMADLAEMDFDLDLIGFSSDEINAIGFDENSETDMPELPSGEKEPFQQKTFTLHNEQAAIIDDSLSLAKTNPLSDCGLNENTVLARAARTACDVEESQPPVDYIHWRRQPYAIVVAAARAGGKSQNAGMV